MFQSKYLPVNIKRLNATVYSQKATYPVDLLLKAEAALRTGFGLNKQVLIEDNTVTFVDCKGIHWSIPEIYLAAEAYHAAEDNDFSFYAVMDDENIPQLFISKAFKKHRVMVNAHTFESVIITREDLVKRAATLIDHQYSFQYCMDFFKTVKDIDDNKGKYIEAIIIDRYSDDESMVVSPLISLYAEDNNMYSKEVITDYRTLLERPGTDCEYVQECRDKLSRKNVAGYQPVTKLWAQQVVDMYDKCKAKKNNYIALCNEDYEALYYVSSNFRYLVNARNFEYKVITNMYMKNLLQKYAVKDNIDDKSLHYCWDMVNAAEAVEE